jgi:hypothetical protein
MPDKHWDFDVGQTFPKYDGPWPGFKPTNHILVLTDDDGSFNEEDRFGLTELVSALDSTTAAFAEFSVTTAHRDTGTGETANADIQAFRFDNPDHFDPERYDQVWLMGIREAVSDVGLSEAELNVLARFMDGGGGVFATGDHQDLGGALCGQIPRVRSMRKWTYDYSADYEEFDPASGHGPPVYGPFRHDTLVAGHDTVFTFDDQSDDIPAPITPKYYGFGNKYFVAKYPHPLLCGPRGVIDVLPDHMHEGECIVPADLSKQFEFDGYSGAEYPGGEDGQVEPDLIAWGHVTSHTTDNTGIEGILDVPSKATSFGVIGAYDGQAAGVGRVVVDSTFHHFVNINVIASGANSSDPVKQAGFAYSPEGQAAYAQIRAYWRNIAIWLARPATQVKMLNSTFWAARWDSQLRMVLPGMVHGRDPSWRQLYQYGVSVRSTMARFSTPCMSHAWIFAWEHPLAKYKWWLRLTLSDPPPWERDESLIDPQEYLLGVLGAVMTELVRSSPREDRAFARELEDRMPPIVRAGLEVAGRAASVHYERRIDATREMLAAVRGPESAS